MFKIPADRVKKKTTQSSDFALDSLAVLRLQDSDGIHDLGYPQVFIYMFDKTSKSHGMCQRTFNQKHCTVHILCFHGTFWSV